MSQSSRDCSNFQRWTPQCLPVVGLPRDLGVAWRGCSRFCWVPLQTSLREFLWAFLKDSSEPSFAMRGDDLLIIGVVDDALEAFLILTGHGACPHLGCFG